MKTITGTYTFFFMIISKVFGDSSNLSNYLITCNLFCAPIPNQFLVVQSFFLGSSLLIYGTICKCDRFKKNISIAICHSPLCLSPAVPAPDCCSAFSWGCWHRAPAADQSSAGSETFDVPQSSSSHRSPWLVAPLTRRPPFPLVSPSGNRNLESKCQHSLIDTYTIEYWGCMKPILLVRRKKVIPKYFISFNYLFISADYLLPFGTSLTGQTKGTDSFQPPAIAQKQNHPIAS